MMRAAILKSPSSAILDLCQIDVPQPRAYQIRIKVEACAVCRTDLHILDRDLRDAKYPLVPGHEIVGIVEECGNLVQSVSPGDRVGVPWVGRTCLECDYCKEGHENLCDRAYFTGYTIDGGFAEFTLADSRFCFKIPSQYDAIAAAPLLCAGLIGWRALSFVSHAESIGVYGFGAAAHVITPVAVCQGKRIFAFTSPGAGMRQDFARSLGACWAGGSDLDAPQKLDAAIIFASAGHLIPKALADLKKGGMVVCGGIHMSDIPSFPYSLLWGERTIKSVANLTRHDGEKFFEFASKMRIETQPKTYSLEQVNKAIEDVRKGLVYGAAVIVP